MKKYKLTDTTIEVGGVTLYQIEAVVDFGGIQKGERGGYIRSEHNLSHDGNCWVYDNAHVFGHARVFGNAYVFGDAHVFGHARVFGNASVSGDAHVFGHARVFGNASVFGNAYVAGRHAVTPLQIQGTKHFLNVDYDASDNVLVHIGCQCKTLTEWLREYKKVGEMHRYSADQITEYGEYLKLIKKLYGTKRKEAK